MPSKSPAQKRLMAAAAHTPGGYGGVPQSVGKDFNNADSRKAHAKALRGRSGTSTAAIGGGSGSAAGGGT